MRFKVSGLKFNVSSFTCPSVRRGSKVSNLSKCTSLLSNALIFIFLYFITAGCGSDIQTKQFAEKQSHLSDNLVNAHKQFVKEESAQIDTFIMVHHYDMQKSPTGLRYQIESDNKGEKAERGDVVQLNYEIYLLNGTLCYSSDSIGPMTFAVEKGEAPNGIHEAVQLMRKGDKAQLVLPVHLAYGLSGDQNKIPLESTIYCTLQLTDIKKNSKQ